MKRYIKIFLVFSIAIFFVKCKNNVNEKLPDILDPTYKIYDISGERGYAVEFGIQGSNVSPYAVVINGIQKNITPEDRSGDRYLVNVISQTLKLENFQPEMADKPNGIIFNTEKGYILKPVTFRLTR